MTKLQSAYDLSQFKTTAHFEERALERFGIPATQIKKFLKDSSPIYDTFLATASNRIQAMSKTGTMFVINPNTKEVITVFKSISPQIAEAKQKEFQTELHDMINRYQLLTAQAYIQDIAENITRFNSLSQSLLSNQISELNFATIEQIYKDITVIKSTLNLLTKQNDYYQSHSSTYDPFQQNSFKMNETNNNQPKESVDTAPKIKPPLVTTNPVDYKPKISNKEILQSDKPLSEQLNSQQKQRISNWLTKLGKSQLAGQVMKSIKQNLTKTELLKSVKPQLKVVDYNNFNNLLINITKENN